MLLQEYDDLVESIQEWVRKLMEPLLDDMEAGAQEVLNIARKRTMDLAKFKKSVHKYPDLVHASTVPDTDEDAIVGIILRFLHDNIFQRILYGALDAYTDILSAVENLMQTAVEPKRGTGTIRFNHEIKAIRITDRIRSLFCSQLDRRGIQCAAQRATVQIGP